MAVDLILTRAQKTVEVSNASLQNGAAAFDTAVTDAYATAAALANLAAPPVVGGTISYFDGTNYVFVATITWQIRTNA